MKRPTLKDIARIAEVSIPTVSLVLSGKGRISAEVRDRVMKAAGDLGYFKSQHKIKVNQHSNRNVGMLCRFEGNFSYVQPFLKPMVVAVDEGLKMNGRI